MIPICPCSFFLTLSQCHSSTCPTFFSIGSLTTTQYHSISTTHLSLFLALMKLQTIKILLLVFLTCLTTVQVTVMRYSRIVSPTKLLSLFRFNPRYIVSTTVILSEGLKVLCCSVFYCREEGCVRGSKVVSLSFPLL